MTRHAFDSRQRYDVIVAGARVAGAALAAMLAEDGARVLLVDRGHHGSDTLSTHALMRGGVMQLSRLGVLDGIIASGAPPITAATFVYDGDPVRVPIKPRDGIAALYAPRRTVLDRMLVDRAIAAGATVAHQVVLVDVIQRRDGRVTGAVLHDAQGGVHPIGADLVVGADGLHSNVASLVNAPLARAGRHSSAIVFGYWRGLHSNEYRWYWGDGVSAGVIPTNDGLTCVFASVPTAAFSEWFQQGVPPGYHRILDKVAPDIAPALQPHLRDGRLRGFAGARGHLRQPVGDGWALIGDAAYFKDPLTSHGITDALVEAEYLSMAIREGRREALNDYAVNRERRVLPLFELTDRIASFQWSLDEVRVLHKSLSAAMADEVEALRTVTREMIGI